jgi:DNA-binding response OmpR family regulator
VLVVEDDRDVATLLEGALEARGAEVVVVRNADELHRAASETYDAALIDLSPIASDVPGALTALREGSPRLALVIISGSAVGLPEVLEGEGVRWVRKPFEIGEVVAALLEKRDNP